jgi:hypothetical protein
MPPGYVVSFPIRAVENDSTAKGRVSNGLGPFMGKVRTPP